MLEVRDVSEEHKKLLEALRLLTERPELLTEVLSLSGVGGAELTVRELWERHYEPWGKAHHGSWKDAHSSYGAHLLRLLGELPWTSLTYDLVDKYVATRQGEKARTTGRPISNATINREISILKVMLSWCIRPPRSLIRGPNPLTRYPALPEIKTRRWHMTEGDFVRLLEHCSRMLRQMLIVAFETGMRRDEFRCLEWQELDLEHGVIRLPKHRVKGKRKGRSIPLTDVAIEVLRSVEKHHETYVFVNPRGDKDATSPVAKTTLYRWFCRARKAAGVSGPNGAEVWVHTLRKSFGTINAMESRIPIYLLMQIMGHVSKSVHDEYTQVSMDYLERARQMLNSRRGPKAADEEAKPSPLLRFIDRRSPQK